MNRKLIAFFAAGLACGSLYAADVYAGDGATADTAQTFCRIKIDGGRRETVLAIPLTTANGSTTVNVTNFVLTTNLKAGDKLGTRIDGKWAYWTLKTDGGKWQADTVVDENDQVSATNAELPVGDCIRLTRAGNYNGDYGSFYLYGLIPTINSKSQEVTAGAWTMLANPLPEPITISAFSAKISSGPVDGDAIYLSRGEKGIIEYTYVYDNNTKSGSWGYDTWTSNNGILASSRVTLPDNTKIPAGEGFFFVAKTGSRTITWIPQQQQQ